MFYVIKSLSKNKYAIQWDDGSYKFGSFEKAIKWSNYYDAMDDLDGYENIGDLIVVGPCEEGEEP